MIAFSWDQRIARAEKLAQEQSAGAEILVFYALVSRFQKGVYERLKAHTGSVDAAVLAPDFLEFLRLIERAGPSAIAEQARTLECGNTSWEEVLAADPSHFFARAMLQPYMERLVSRNNIPSSQTEARRCPYCGEEPQAGVLRGEGDGAKRSLLCSMCSSEWQFRRLLCPACGEEKNDRLPVYIAAQFEHVRVEACDTCNVYIKSVDLTKNGLAVPCVDEIATVSLDLWAAENGYKKLKNNLLGM